MAISIDLFANFWYSIWAGKKSGAKVPFLPQEKPMERWSSGLRHTLGKRARLTASAGSNPVLSATESNPTQPVGLLFSFPRNRACTSLRRKEKTKMRSMVGLHLLAESCGAKRCSLLATTYVFFSRSQPLLT